MTADNDPTADGVGLAAFVIASCLMLELKDRGLLQAQAVSDLIDGARLRLEQYGLSKDATKAAHSLLGQMVRILDKK